MKSKHEIQGILDLHNDGYIVNWYVTRDDNEITEDVKQEAAFNSSAKAAEFIQGLLKDRNLASGISVRCPDGEVIGF